MTAPIRLHPDPTTLPPPHGPDHADCLDCGRMRRFIGHVPLVDAETLAARTHRCALIAEAMQIHGEVWREVGPTARRRTARRFAFARWLRAHGALTDADNRRERGVEG